ncbi:MAG: hypothetical protein A3G87_03810 [Omnitrophica bacterium RIFCSPLOWO2_12_FULL_50_11]|nr:MAG: hypothetical protein A3G87_03810 [Omnitrophica bacterium RIFCSPLOWO2_12_FULL_50_11]
MDSNVETKIARRLLLSQKYGVLSTHSLEVPGYPFGSITPYCLDRQGHAIILISNLAQHFKNIRANPKVSLTIVEGRGPEVQAQGRLTYLADAVGLEASEQDARERYYTYFPDSREFTESHGFFFFRLKPVKLRFIGGFGKIDWIEPDQFFLPNPFTGEEEKSILTHMNQNHREALRSYLRRFKEIDVKDEEAVTMVGIDGEGFDLLATGRMIRFSFEKFIANMNEARQALVAMSRVEK